MLQKLKESVRTFGYPFRKEERDQEILTLNGSIKRVVQKGTPLGEYKPVIVSEERLDILCLWLLQHVENYILLTGKSGVTGGESFFAFNVQERNLLVLKEWHCPKQQDFPQWLLHVSPVTSGTQPGLVFLKLIL